MEKSEGSLAAGRGLAVCTPPSGQVRLGVALPSSRHWHVFENLQSRKEIQINMKMSERHNDGMSVSTIIEQTEMLLLILGGYDPADVSGHKMTIRPSVGHFHVVPNMTFFLRGKSCSFPYKILYDSYQSATSGCQAPKDTKKVPMTHTRHSKSEVIS